MCVKNVATHRKELLIAEGAEARTSPSTNLKRNSILRGSWMYKRVRQALGETIGLLAEISIN
jgi:hypothetical protein